ncbi:MAG: type 4a pilus biogenesis protein PilO [Chitinivibrionales bacterium]
MHLENRHVNALLAPVLVFSCSALVSLLIMRYSTMPQWEALTARGAVLASFKNSVFQNNDNALLRKQLLEEKDSLKIKYHDLAREIGGSHDLSGVLQMIIAKANGADIAFVKMQPEAETRSGTTTIYPLILECSATYNAYGKFIAALETQPSVVRVDRIAITARKNELLEIRTLVTCFIQAKP